MAALGLRKCQRNGKDHSGSPGPDQRLILITIAIQERKVTHSGTDPLDGLRRPFDSVTRFVRALEHTSRYDSGQSRPKNAHRRLNAPLIRSHGARKCAASNPNL